ncbi:hypothetical protein PPN31114_00296 [Pandoraea pneumonica]|uniref:Glycerophosphoryl diester phosphodiesterase membrane domain-containing protein n=1 Tax=Pandoraea pneumonica TaxID=2508299 RepID=A0A5E4RN89_9BURK|nr:hypothetical protein [Pandoraea pneumonica]VVD64880.1 hypothetical protein PPN31114_00296 [Pandoraea pneumonica]
MEPITFKQCFMGAWRDGWNALRSRPLLTLTVAVVVLVSNAVSVSIKQLVLVMAQNGESPEHRLALAGVGLCVALVNLVAYTVLGVHTYRHTVLGPDAARQTPWYRNLLRYWWAMIQVFGGAFVAMFIVTVVIVLALRLADLGGSRATILTLFVLLGCAAAFIIVRLSLIYTQIAVGRSKRWGAAWHDTRGHFWSLWGTVFTTLLPLMAVGVIVTIIFGLVLTLWPTVTLAVLGALLLHTVVTLLYIAVGSASHAWLYLRYADQLLTYEDAPDDL